MNKSIIVALALVAVVLVQVDANVFSNKITIKARLDKEHSRFGYSSDEYNAGIVEVNTSSKDTTEALAIAACEKIKGEQPVKANLKKEGSDAYLDKELTVADNGLKDGDQIVVECNFREIPRRFVW